MCGEANRESGIFQLFNTRVNSNEFQKNFIFQHEKSSLVFTATKPAQCDLYCSVDGDDFLVGRSKEGV